MKVIITEKQLELLKLIKESEDVIVKFQKRLNNVNEELNKIYTTINFISVAELLNGEINVKELMNKSEKLDGLNLDISRDIQQYFDSFGEETFNDELESLYTKLDDFYYKNSNKINIISSILMDLDDLVEGNVNSGKSFLDIKQINLY